MEPNYFVCTLGQASTLNQNPKPYRTIAEFLDYQSTRCGSSPAVGFTTPRASEIHHELLTFREVQMGTRAFAARLTESLFSTRGTGETVALMAHSSPEFLFTWLGLIYLGRSVLLLAPQCQPAAIVYLCKAYNVSLFFHDDAHGHRARETERWWKQTDSGQFQICGIPLDKTENVFQVIQKPHHGISACVGRKETAVAYLHHTSGTSSGFPKPIPQSHRAAIGVLAHLPGPTPKATFTTTPLYHGGIADVFRSWTSDSPIWLFPGKDLPITARNIGKCLNVANACSSNAQAPAVKYFSSVPYVLQMMESDREGLELLRSMDVVGVGGAALPPGIGNRLVDSDVRLISRFGSAECGFLLSSYRDFTKDKDWQYLRNYNPAELLSFESRGDGLCELVVKPGWPHMAKTNRDNGSFATADLFAKHPTVENAWLYHSRADSQLTLVTGKKFDPAPLEASIATSSHLDDVLVFGNGQPYPGALLLRSKASMHVPDKELLDAIWPHVHKLNQTSQDHARISNNMLISMPHQTEPLEKSSKGTIMRKASEVRYARDIGAAYQSKADGDTRHIDDESLPQYLSELIQTLVQGASLPAQDTDLFSYGVDSIACMKLRSRLRQLTPNYSKEFPLSIVEDCGNVRNLAKYIIRKRHGEADAESEDEQQLMLNLIQDLSTYTIVTHSLGNGCPTEDKHGEIAVLTGATGALGAHILDLLRNSDTVSSIYCLVRGTNKLAAEERVSKALEQRGFEGLSKSNTANHKVKVVRAQLGEPRLGLPDEVYSHLAKRANVIFHIAWTVNFRLKLPSFVKDNLSGVKHLIDLALAACRLQPPRFVYCSSTAAITNDLPDRSGHLSEHISPDPSSASPLGYSRSKWVAEHMCLAAHRQTPLQGHISVVRVGQLSGDSSTGIWNTKEAWPMMLSTAKVIGCLPDLGDEPLDWLPVDIAARAFVEAANISGARGDMPVYHVLNPHQLPTWHDMLQWLKKWESFEIVAPEEWVQRLESCENSEHSAMKLLGLWKKAYSSENKDKKRTPKFAIQETQKHVPTLRDVKPVDEVYVSKIWEWVQATVR